LKFFNDILKNKRTLFLSKNLITTRKFRMKRKNKNIVIVKKSNFEPKESYLKKITRIIAIFRFLSEIMWLIKNIMD